MNYGPTSFNILGGNSYGNYTSLGSFTRTQGTYTLTVNVNAQHFYKYIVLQFMAGGYGGYPGIGEVLIEGDCIKNFGETVFDNIWAAPSQSRYYVKY